MEKRGMVNLKIHLDSQSFHTQSTKEFDSQCGEYEEKQVEEESQVANLRQGLHYSVQQ
jgi:uncharacterized protein (DUF2141 family)